MLKFFLKYIWKNSYLFFLLSCFNVFSQPNNKSFYVKRVSVKDGLKQAAVKNILFDNNGYLWISTELGLYKYNGNKIKEINKFNLDSKRISYLHKDFNSDSLYVWPLNDSKFYSICDNKIKASSKNPRDFIYGHSYCFSKDNNLINSASKNNEYNNLVEDYRKQSFTIFGINSNSLAFATQYNLVLFDKKGDVNFFPFSDLNSKQIINVENKLFLVGRGIKTIIGNKLVDASNNCSTEVQSIFKGNLLQEGKVKLLKCFGDNNNSHYLYNENNVYQFKFKNNKLCLELLFSSPFNDLSCLVYNKKEEYYVLGSHSDGIAFLYPNDFKCAQLNSRLYDSQLNYTYSSILLNENTFYNAKGWSYNILKNAYKIDQDYYKLRSGSIIIEYENEYYIYLEDELKSITENNRKSPNKLLSKNKFWTNIIDIIHINGSYWLIFSDKAGILHKTHFEEYKQIGPLLQKQTIHFTKPLNDSIILIASMNGVMKFNVRQPSKVPKFVKGLEKIYSRYLKIENDKRYWVGTYGNGLYLVDNDKIYHIKDKNININTAHAIEIDKNKNFWLSTNDGLLVTNYDKLVENTLKKKPVEFYQYKVEDGLISNEFNGGGTHPSFQNAEGLIGFCSTKGIVYFQPDSIKKHPFNRNIHIENIFYNGKKINDSSFDKLSIPDSVGIVDLEFSIPYYRDLKNLRIEYSLIKNGKILKSEVLKNKWHINILREDKGKIDLKINVSTNGYYSNADVSKIITLDFKPKFVETMGFKFLIFFLIVFLILSGLFIGRFYSKKREEFLNDKIDIKTKELNYTIEQMEKYQEVISNNLKEKEILLKEIHHRVKNNLQLVISILNIQSRKNNFLSIDDFLEKGQTRIMAMVLIHESLYQNDTMAHLNMYEYIEKMIHNLDTLYATSDYIKCFLNVKNVYISLEASIPVGLILNELLTNIVKHAFPDNRKGEVRIELKEIENQTFELIVQDNGVGFSGKPRKETSFGVELVELLVSQLNGQIKIDTHKGTFIRIIFMDNNFLN